MMKKMEVGKKVLALSLGLFSMVLSAQNPIVQTHYTADPAPMVYGDTLYLYVGCDEKDAPRNAYLMREYRLYTTTDMVNWTDHGAVLRTSAFGWSAGDAIAERRSVSVGMASSIGIFLRRTGLSPARPSV